MPFAVGVGSVETKRDFCLGRGEAMAKFSTALRGAALPRAERRGIIVGAKVLRMTFVRLTE